MADRSDGRARRAKGGKAVGGGGQAMRSWGISRPSRHLKSRLTTQTGEISPEGEIARPRVQAVVEPRKMRGGLCPRGDLNTETGEISPDRGNHAIKVTQRGRAVLVSRHAFAI